MVAVLYQALEQDWLVTLRCDRRREALKSRPPCTLVPQVLHVPSLMRAMAPTFRSGSWTLDIVLEAIRVALLTRESRLKIEHFAQSYAEIFQAPDRENPFIAADWAGIDTILHRSRVPDGPSQTKRQRRKREETPW